MHTGTLIDELMAVVEQAMTDTSREQQQKRFFVWDAVSHEQRLEAQPELAGVA